VSDTTSPESPVDLDQSKKDFDESQASLAEAQNVSGEGAVPEQRPQASQQFDGPPHSELTQKLIDAGDPNVPNQDGPMDKAAYDRAASDSQAKKAAKASVAEGIHVGNVIRVVDEDSPHNGRVFAVTRVTEDPNRDATVLRASGSPEQLYITPNEVEARAIRDERDGELILLRLDEVNVEKVRDGLGSLARR
jgi:hypothetical protein